MMINMSFRINLLPRFIHTNSGQKTVGGHAAVATRTIPVAVADKLNMTAYEICH